MNIGLDVAGSANSLADIERRAMVAVNHLKATFGVVWTRRYESEYEGPNGIVLESGLFASIDVLYGASSWMAYAAEGLAKALEQDCIAVYIPAWRKGRLIGPKAAEWGDFNIEYFKRFEREVA